MSAGRIFFVFLILVVIMYSILSYFVKDGQLGAWTAFCILGLPFLAGLVGLLITAIRRK